MKRLTAILAIFIVVSSGYAAPWQQQPTQDSPKAQAKIPNGAKVFIAAMGGFEAPLKKAIADKKVPIQIVEQRDQAEYEITGTSESKKASPRRKSLWGVFTRTKKPASKCQA